MYDKRPWFHRKTHLSSLKNHQPWSALNLVTQLNLRFEGSMLTVVSGIFLQDGSHKGLEVKRPLVSMVFKNTMTSS